MKQKIKQLEEKIRELLLSIMLGWALYGYTTTVYLAKEGTKIFPNLNLFHIGEVSDILFFRTFFIWNFI